MKQFLILLLSFQLIAANHRLENDLQIVQKCYDLGKKSADLQVSCDHLPSSLKVDDNQHKICLSSYAIACLNSYENSTCEFGIEAAQKFSTCQNNSPDLVKKCCNACLLGVEIQSSLGSCTNVDNLLKLDAQTLQIVNKCCHFELKRLEANVVEENTGHFDEFQKIVATTTPYVKTLKTLSGMCSKHASLCDENEICYDTEEDYTCQCKVGFSKNTTSNICEDIDECSENLHSCETFEICINEPEQYRCEAVTCSEGMKVQSNSLIGRDIECVDVDECLDNPCNKNELCSNTLGSFECVQIDVLSQHCDDGFEMVDDDCVDKNECRDDVCGKNEICTNLKGSYRCEKIECGKHYSRFLKSNCQRKNCKDKTCHKLPAYIMHFFKVVDLKDTNRTIITMQPRSMQSYNDFKLIKFDKHHFEFFEAENSAEIRMIKLPQIDSELMVEVNVQHKKYERKHLNIYHVYVQRNE